MNKKLSAILFFCMLLLNQQAHAYFKGGAFTVISSTIAINELTNNFIYQRAPSSTSKSVTFTGTYAGLVPNTVEVQVTNLSSSVIVAWTALSSATITGGTFTGTLSTPQGGWYKWQVRSKDAGGNIIASSNISTNEWGVGIVVSVIGQSNALGLFDETFSGQPSPSSLTTMICCTGGPSGPQPTPTIAAVAGAGAITLANSLHTAFNVPIALIAYPIGATGLTSGAPGINGWYWLTNSAFFPWPQYLAGLAFAGGDSEMAVWNQGEQDGINGVTPTTYFSGLQSLQSMLYTATGRNSSTFKFFVSGCGSNYDSSLGTPSATTTGISGFVCSAQYQFGTTGGAGVYWAGSGGGLPYGGQSGSDIAHYNAQSQAHLAHRYSNAIQNAYGIATNTSIGPTISDATRPAGSPVITVTVTQHGGTQLIDRSGGTTGTGITGFVVLVNGVAATISSTAFVQPNQIQLTLSSAPANGATVKLSYLLNWYASNIVYDGTDNLAFDNQSPDGDTVGLPLLPPLISSSFGVPFDYGLYQPVTQL